MAPKGRAEGAGCVFPWETRRVEEMKDMEEKKEERDGMSAEEDDDGKLWEAQGLFFLCIVNMLLLHIIYLLLLFAIYSLLRNLVQYLISSWLQVKLRENTPAKSLKYFFCRNPYISEIIFHINYAGRTAEKYI